MRRFTALLVLLALVATVASFVVAPARGWWFPENASVFGERIDALFRLILWPVSFFLVLTLGLLAWIVWRAAPTSSVSTGESAREPHARTQHGDRRLELVWTLIPGAILLFLALRQMGDWAELRYSSHRPVVPVTARVVASQFDWHFVYPGADGRFGTLDDLDAPYELLVPANEPVVLELSSRDVIHSFFVASLRVKQDVLPGRRIEIWFEVREPGEYEIACAELCGWGHYKMAGKLRALPRAEYDRELARLAHELVENGAPDAQGSRR